jgi:PKHD-type hydroxylase
MNGYWCYHKNRWNPEYCKDILNRVDLTAYLIGTVGNGKVDPSIRRSKVQFIQATDTNFKDVFSDIWAMALEANLKFFNFHISKLDFIQITKYDANDLSEYKSHKDVFWLNDDPIYHRKLSCSIQLSDPNDYDGGDFKILNIDTAEPTPEDVRSQGTAIFFPSFIDHQVTPITRGTRYSIVGWFEGPKWR